MRASVEHVDAAWKCETSLENIGLGGACRLLGRHVVFDDILSVSFTALTLWDPSVPRGRIVRVRTEEVTARVGVAFEHQNTQAVLALHELIVGLAYD